MKYLGSIDLEKPITLNGKPHGIEWIDTLPTWTAAHEGRVYYISSAKKLYIGRSDAWEELTEGHVGPHTHDDRYYTQTALLSGSIDSRYYTETEVDTALTKKSDTTHNHDAAYSAIHHDNASHTEIFITSSGVTFEALNANGDVGSGEGQIATGIHNHDTLYATIAHDHDTVYSKLDHNHTGVYAVVGHDHDTVYSKLDHKHDDLYASLSHNHDLAYANITHAHDDLYNTKSEVSTALSGKSDTTHNHDTVYAIIGHTHAELYAALDHNHDLSYASISHTHNDLYNTKSEVASYLAEKSDATHNHDTVYALIGHKHDSEYSAVDHNHDGRYSLENHNHDLVYAALSHNHDLVYAALSHNHDLVYAALSHNHDDLYNTKSEISTALSGKSDTTHTHTEFVPYATEVSGLPADTPVVGTIRLDSDASKLYIYTSSGWKTATLA